MPSAQPTPVGSALTTVMAAELRPTPRMRAPGRPIPRTRGKAPRPTTRGSWPRLDRPITGDRPRTEPRRYGRHVPPAGPPGHTPNPGRRTEPREWERAGVPAALGLPDRHSWHAPPGRPVRPTRRGARQIPPPASRRPTGVERGWKPVPQDAE